jgi:plasmid stabilization system protein ParE
VAKVVWTAEAEQWLLRIHDYVAQDKPEAAFHLVESIYLKAEILSSFPEIGYIYTTVSGRSLRVLLYGKYRIAYLVLPDEARILGVFHGAMELKNYLS